MPDGFMVQRVFMYYPNVILAAFLIGFAAALFWLEPPTGWIDYEFWFPVAMYLAFGVLSLMRPPPRAYNLHVWVVVVCCYSIFYVFLFERVGESENETMIRVNELRKLLQIIAQLSILSLGRSFAIFPALRVVKTGMLYGWVRHPVYSLLILADICFIIVQFSWWNLAVALSGILALGYRANIEEAVLSEDPEYGEYMSRVKSRFIPWVY